MNEIFTYFDAEHDRYMKELFALLSIPSISSKDEHKADMQRTASFLADHMNGIGLTNVGIHPTKGHPVVYGEWLGAPGKPTVLIYGHYDVQPAEPLELWESPPFVPEIRKGQIFGRGTADDKGQLFIHLKVIEALLKKRGSLPVNVKVILEGEEEIGSTNLADYLKKNKKKLGCDVILVSDTHMAGITTPSITYGLRGLTYLEVTVTTANTDMHSGTYGGSVANPIQVLAELLVKCKDPKTSKVKIPGFYDDVVPLTKKDRAELAKNPFDERKFLKGLGARKTFGEAGYSVIERTGCRPTFEVNGIWGGYTDPGVKTVLPAKAAAKVSMRLVANQDPNTIAKKFMEYIKSIAPDTVKVDVHLYDNNGHAALTPIDSVGMQAAAAAIRTVYKKDPLYTREGGSIPVVADFQNILGSNVVLLGFGLEDDRLHAPNEKFDVVQFKNGLKTATAFLEEMGKK